MAQDKAWQLAFWVITGLFFGTCLTGYFKLDAKIAQAQEIMTKEKEKDIDLIRDQMDKIDDKVESIRTEQSVMREDTNKKLTQILISLEQLKARVQ